MKLIKLSLSRLSFVKLAVVERKLIKNATPSHSFRGGSGVELRELDLKQVPSTIVVRELGQALDRDRGEENSRVLYIFRAQRWH